MNLYDFDHKQGVSKIDLNSDLFIEMIPTVKLKW